MTTTKEMVLKACETMGDDPDGLVCYYVTLCSEGRCYHFAEDGLCDAKLVGPVGVDELPARKFYDGYGEVEGERLLCFSEEHVYFKKEYDGSESVTAVLRDPKFVIAARDIPWAV